MPLGSFELEVLRLLAANRNPDSYVAGATVLNQDPASPRTSKDVDVFQDTVESLDESADRDFATLTEPVTLPQLKERWLATSSAARELIARLPLDEVGCLYLDRAGKPVSPDPASPDFPKLTRHFGSVKGAWPRIVES